MKYALALAGGGTRGAFQVGVWQALKELGIEVSAICGTSIGAVNGAMFASGKDGEELWKSIKAQDVADIKGDNMFSLTSLFSLVKKIRDGGVDATAFGDFLSEVLNEDDVRNSPIDFGLCTFRNDTKESKELFTEDIPQGQLLQFVLASAAFPLFKPVNIDGAEYSDGALRNNLPVNMLINKGYDTIISVSVKGPGVVKNIDRCGVNIIEINAHSPEVGVMDFDTKAIADSIKSGYYECMRVFGKYCGEVYSITPESYQEARLMYGPQIIAGLEEAADMCKINPYTVYTFDELVDKVLKEYKNHKSLKLMTTAMEKDLPGKNMLDGFGKIFRAANSVVYLKNKKSAIS